MGAYVAATGVLATGALEALSGVSDVGGLVSDAQTGGAATHRGRGLTQTASITVQPTEQLAYGIQLQMAVLQQELCSTVTPVCSSHGTCDAQDRCQCSAGYAGPRCQFECAGGAANPCSGRGTCVSSDGSCACETGAAGPDCSVAVQVQGVSPQ